jgi:hypothetical protein
VSRDLLDHRGKLAGSCTLDIFRLDLTVEDVFSGDLELVVLDEVTEGVRMG